MKWLSKWKWELFSPVAGLLLTFSFAPFDYSYLALISLVYIFFCWQKCSPARAAFRGYLYGLGMFGLGISWVYISVHDFGGAPAFGALLLTTLVVCFWALFPALTGYLSVRVARLKQKGCVIWFIPFVWILIEYFRGYWLLNGFPWLQIAYSQLGTPLQGFVPLVGVYGTGFLLAMSASVIVAGLYKFIKVPRAFVIVIPLWSMGAYLQTVQWTEAIGDEIKVALIQGNISQDQKWLPKNRIPTLLSYQRMTMDNWDSDIIIWPETAIPAFLSQVKESFIDPLSAEAKSHNTALIVSLPSSDKAKKYYNTVLSLGRYEGQYHKNHLLPFGEYLPLQPLSGFVLGLLNIQLGNFSSGGVNQTLLQAGSYPFSTSICYEDAFGAEAIRDLPEAAFLVNVTNDAWFADSIEPHQHMQLAQMRALETGRYLLRTTNTGVTAIVAPDGMIIKKAPQFKKIVLKGTILPMGGMTPYARLGDGPIVFTLFVGAIFFIGYLLVYIKKSIKNE